MTTREDTTTTNALPAIAGEIGLPTPAKRTTREILKAVRAADGDWTRLSTEERERWHLRLHRNARIFTLSISAPILAGVFAYSASSDAATSITTGTLSDTLVGITGPYTASFDYTSQVHNVNFKTGDALISEFKSVGYGGGGAGGHKDISEAELQELLSDACEIAKAGMEYELQWYEKIFSHATDAMKHVKNFGADT